MIVRSSPDTSITIDRRGLSVVAFPARALRIVDQADGLTPQVLAALLQASHGGRRAGGAVRSGWRLEDWQLQIPDRESLTHLDELLTTIHERRTRAQNELDALDQLIRLTTAGLADGTITLRA